VRGIKVVKDTETDYGRISKVNHWLVALVVIILLGLGLYFHDLPRGPDRAELQALHASIGVLAILYFVFRVFWRNLMGFPEDPPGPEWQAKLARFVHIVLLVAIIVQAVSGPMAVWTTGRSIHVFNWFSLWSPMPRNMALHETFEVIHAITAQYVILPLLVLHVLAALKRTFIDRDGTLRRMSGI